MGEEKTDLTTVHIYDTVSSSVRRSLNVRHLLNGRHFPQYDSTQHLYNDITERRAHNADDNSDSQEASAKPSRQDQERETIKSAPEEIS